MARISSFFGSYHKIIARYIHRFFLCYVLYQATSKDYVLELSKTLTDMEFTSVMGGLFMLFSAMITADFATKPTEK